MSVRVDAAVPHGNVTGVSVTEEASCVRVAFTAHPHGGPERLWFCFRVVPEDSALDDRPLHLTLSCVDTLLGASRLENIRPVIRSAGEDWRRLPSGETLQLPDGRRQLVWTLPPPASALDVAFCYPYGLPELETALAECAGAWRSDVIGVSQEGRTIARLANDYGHPNNERPGVYIVARQHSGETPGSWVLDGLLRRLAERRANAPVTWAVPFADIDGVERGDYGKDAFPYDVNRAWGVSPMRHETLTMQQDLGRWQYRCKPALVIDLHAPGACEAAGVYSFVPRISRCLDHHRDALRWADAIGAALSSRYAAEPFARVADYPSRWETSRLTEYARDELGVCALGLEIPYALADGVLLGPAEYRDIGARVGDCLIAELATSS